MREGTVEYEQALDAMAGILHRRARRGARAAEAEGPGQRAPIHGER